MIPATLLVIQKIADLLNSNGAFEQALSALNTEYSVSVPSVTPENVVLTYAPESMSDLNLQFAYPRIAVYTTAMRNSQLEKYRPLSGTAAVVAEIFASGDLLDQTNLWTHFYIEAFTSLLRENVGDWGDGVFFGGAYEIQIKQPKIAGLGFLQVSTVSLTLTISGD